MFGLIVVTLYLTPLLVLFWPFGCVVLYYAKMLFMCEKVCGCVNVFFTWPHRLLSEYLLFTYCFNDLFFLFICARCMKVLYLRPTQIIHSFSTLHTPLLSVSVIFSSHLLVYLCEQGYFRFCIAFVLINLIFLCSCILFFVFLSDFVLIFCPSRDFLSSHPTLLFFCEIGRECFVCGYTI